MAVTLYHTVSCQLHDDFQAATRPFDFCNASKCAALRRQVARQLDHRPSREIAMLVRLPGHPSHFLSAVTPSRLLVAELDRIGAPTSGTSASPPHPVVCHSTFVVEVTPLASTGDAGEPDPHTNSRSDRRCAGSPSAGRRHARTLVTPAGSTSTVRVGASRVHHNAARPLNSSSRPRSFSARCRDGARPRGAAPRPPRRPLFRAGHPPPRKRLKSRRTVRSRHLAHTASVIVRSRRPVPAHRRLSSRPHHRRRPLSRIEPPAAGAGLSYSRQFAPIVVFLALGGTPRTS